MIALARLLVAGLIGATAFCALPRTGLLAATQEVLGLLSVIMAGLLPTMLLTATVLRAASLSAKRVTEYGAALRAQMHFWAVLFVACLVGSLSVTATAIFGAPDVQFTISLGKMSISETHATDVAVAITGASIGVILLRLPPSYEGILSLLTFNVEMAKDEASVADGRRAEAFVRDVTGSANLG